MPPFFAFIGVPRHNRAVNTILRILLLIWVVGYLFTACGPLLNGDLLIGGVTFIAAVVFFVPWLLVAVLLFFLIQVTNRRRD